MKRIATYELSNHGTIISVDDEGDIEINNGGTHSSYIHPDDFDDAIAAGAVGVAKGSTTTTARRERGVNNPTWSAWLIEREFATGTQFAWFSNWGVRWTKDPLAACHFVRKSDAEQFTGGDDEIRVEEHEFVGTSPLDDKTEPAPAYGSPSREWAREAARTEDHHDSVAVGTPKLDTAAMDTRFIESLGKAAREVDALAQQSIADRYDAVMKDQHDIAKQRDSDAGFWIEMSADLSIAYSLAKSLPRTADGYLVAERRRVFFTTFEEVLWLDVDCFLPPGEHDGYHEGWVLCGNTQHQTREQIPAIKCFSLREEAERYRTEKGATR